MEQNFEDARVFRTKRDIKRTFIKLLLDGKDFNKISVKDITEISHYNRSTFYDHFKDKNNLLDYVVEDVLDGFMMSFKNGYPNEQPYNLSEVSQSTIKFFDYILENKALFSFLFLNSKVFGFKERLLEVIENDLLTEIIFPEIELRNMDKKLFVKMKAHIILSHISFWIEEDFQQSIVYMNEQLLKNLTFIPQKIELKQK